MSNAVNKFKPDWLHLVPPGLSMKEDMEHVGFSQVEFAQRMGYTAKHIHKLIKGEASITADTALKLEKVLSYPSSFWLNTILIATTLPQSVASSDVFGIGSSASNTNLTAPVRSMANCPSLFPFKG
jgi:addiction module HigA family antidote